MFNLIVTILALVLMIGAAIAGLTYLGPAFTNSQTKAYVAQLVNAGEQIEGAWILNASDNGGSYLYDTTPGSSVAALTPNYLNSVPAVPAFAVGASWTITGAPATAPATGEVAPFSLGLVLGSSQAAAAVCTLMAAEVGTGPYGCTGTGATTAFFLNM